MKPKIYIETSIPSFYYETRTEPSMVARKEWTKEWWDNNRNEYNLHTSIPVIEELEKGNHPHKKQTLKLIENISLLPIEDEIYEIVEEYINKFLMPKNPTGDALHLALASYHHCHFLLTWNCNHLANANKFEHIRHINNTLGLFVPNLITPLELMKLT